MHILSQVVAVVFTHPACAHVTRGYWRSIRETGVGAQGDNPRTPICVEPPRFGEARNRSSLAIDANQRLVQLTEQQPLAVVSRARRVRWIDAFGERDGCNRFARRGKQAAFTRCGFRTRRNDGRSRRWGNRSDGSGTLGRRRWVRHWNNRRMRGRRTCTAAPRQCVKADSDCSSRESATRCPHAAMIASTYLSPRAAAPALFQL